AFILFFFFFQAEDGIRGFHVTGVQTCALPIWCGRGGRGREARGQARLVLLRGRHRRLREVPQLPQGGRGAPHRHRPGGRGQGQRSEERRVGKEWRSRR